VSERDESKPVELRTGARLRSRVCATEVIVVRAPTHPIELACGGQPMAPIGAEVERRDLDPALAGGALLGKRYTVEAEDAFEVLVTKAGAGTLAAGTEPLVVKQARPLPASD
jgi:hypothetical protein